MLSKHNMHRQRDQLPLGYFLTMRTYGTWLHGDARGSVDDKHNGRGMPRITPDANRQSQPAAAMSGKPFLLNADSAALVEQIIQSVCTHRQWKLYTVHARTNHVHVVVGAHLAPERMMNDFKAWSTRQLREMEVVAREQKIWAEHGSTPYLWTEMQLAGAIDYVRNWQGGALQRSWDEMRAEIDEQERCARAKRLTLADATGSVSTLADATGSVRGPT